MSSIVSVDATSCIGALAGADRAPVLKPMSCRRMYAGERPASGGMTPTHTRPVQGVAGLVAKKRMNPLIWAGAAVIVIGLGVGGWLLSRGGGSSGKILRIGVMPIEDISKQDSMFVTALHAALTNALSKGGTVGVASFSEMMHFKGSTKTNKEIAAELKLDAIVEATVFRAGDVMRINVQLSNPVTTRNLWAETYNPNVKNVLAAQDSVVTKIEHGVDSVLAGPKKPGATP